MKVNRFKLVNFGEGKTSEVRATGTLQKPLDDSEFTFEYAKNFLKSNKLHPKEGQTVYVNLGEVHHLISSTDYK